MLNELEAALLAKLSDIPVDRENLLKITGGVQPGTLFPLQYVPVSVMIPEHWARQANLPAINIWRLDCVPKPQLFRTGTHQRPKERDDGAGASDKEVEQKRHQLPFTAIYEIGIRVRQQQHLTDMMLALHQRMPPLGYGSRIDVTIPDGMIYVPFRQTGFADLTEPEQAGERMMEARVTYEMDIWMDLDQWKVEKLVHQIVLVTDFTPSGEPHDV